MIEQGHATGFEVKLAESSERPHFAAAVPRRVGGPNLGEHLSSVRIEARRRDWIMQAAGVKDWGDPRLNAVVQAKGEEGLFLGMLPQEIDDEVLFRDDIRLTT